MREARENAMKRFITFLNNCRDELRPLSRSRRRDFCEHQPFNFEDDVGLQMAKELMETYRKVKQGLLYGKPQSWALVSEILERYLKTLSEDHHLIPLINYYLVSNILPFSRVLWVSRRPFDYIRSASKLLSSCSKTPGPKQAHRLSSSLFLAV
jgi:hypothetical protein